MIQQSDPERLALTEDYEEAFRICTSGQNVTRFLEKKVEVDESTKIVDDILAPRYALFSSAFLTVSKNNITGTKKLKHRT